MLFVLTAIGLLAVSAFAALLAPQRSRWPTALGVGGCVGASFLGILAALRALSTPATESLRWEWAVPYGAFSLGLDALSAWFILPIFGLSSLAAVYGSGYLARRGEGNGSGGTYFAFNWLVASMVLVVLARNAVLFLMAWEIMSLASFFLVTFEDEDEHVREAGWIYLVATHLGTAFLLVLFLLLGRETGSLEFGVWEKAAGFAPATVGFLFVLAVVGFGTKAGFMPLHVWLPEAHPAAPSHVSALMSGVMIKTGIYGLVRTLTWLGQPAAWWGWVLVGIGLSSGILGVLFALAQHDLKRLLAYHSVENIGIIALGLGLGVLGSAAGIPVLGVLGYCGALLHVLNHAVFKGLLFLGAGSVLQRTGTREMDRLGGLLKRMPWTGVTFLVGAAAICGLPPLNGFISELLIFQGAYAGAVSAERTVAVLALGTIAGLGLIGGLAVACFTKAFGITFLGEPRTAAAAHASESGRLMGGPMVLLATTCVLLGVLSPWVLGGMAPVVATAARLPSSEAAPVLTAAGATLMRVTLVTGTLWIAIATLAWLRKHLLRRRTVSLTVTWDCGYVQPTARMQYTASSFAQPIKELFAGVLRTHRRLIRPKGYFPREAFLETDTADFCHGNLYHPAFVRLNWALARLRSLQQGKVQLYVLYIALTVLALLVWELR